MRKSRGFSLIEVMVAIVILGIVITTTISMFAERQKRLKQANETILAYQALANEAEIWRRIDFASLDGQPPVFQSDLTILAPLAPYTTAVRIDTTRPDTKNITLTVRWSSAQRTAKLGIVRVDTGGSSLW
ncbi:MAG TPA: prepilin-type N-terminal cleavage/methylation domain-containing protein [Thermoanaerobaculia bacterium]|nr:prepilin-type N-terminal cleavage/methylation domain-containing protein [Thermoanaerobaculia bacterium]